MMITDEINIKLKKLEQIFQKEFPGQPYTIHICIWEDETYQISIDGENPTEDVTIKDGLQIARGSYKTVLWRR